MSSDLESFDPEKADFFKEFESLRPDLVYSDSWSVEQKKEANKLLKKGRAKVGMLSLIPLHCKGPDCIYAPMAPLIHEDYPKEAKRPCPVESAAVNDFFWDYVEELSVDVSRMVEVSMVRDLVDQEIQQLRKSVVLSQEHFIQENVVGLNDQGEVVTKKELHQAIDYEERLLKRKEKLRNALLATRESKAKIGQGQADGATVISNILAEVEKVNRARQKALLQELGMEEYDEYIAVEEDEELVDERDLEDPPAEEE